MTDWAERAAERIRDEVAVFCSWSKAAEIIREEWSTGPRGSTCLCVSRSRLEELQARVRELEGHNEELQSLDGLQQLRIEQLEAERDAWRAATEGAFSPPQFEILARIIATHLQQKGE
jgi:hypothetical protein